MLHKSELVKRSVYIFSMYVFTKTLNLMIISINYDTLFNQYTHRWVVSYPLTTCIMVDCLYAILLCRARIEGDTYFNGESKS